MRELNMVKGWPYSTMPEGSLGANIYGAAYWGE